MLMLSIRLLAEYISYLLRTDGLYSRFESEGTMWNNSIREIDNTHIPICHFFRAVDHGLKLNAAETSAAGYLILIVPLRQSISARHAIVMPVVGPTSSPFRPNSFHRYLCRFPLQRPQWNEASDPLKRRLIIWFTKQRAWHKNHNMGRRCEV